MNVNEVLQRGGGIVRQSARIADQLTRRVVSETYGVVAQARHLRPAPKPGMDDVTLARKVETVVFRNYGDLKSTVNVNAVDGVVWLRGEARRPEQVRKLEQMARSVPEVRGVENLLHLPKTPAPTRADTPRHQQRTRSSTRRPTPRRTEGRITDDRSDAIVDEAEAPPAEHARTGAGRTAAPFGSRGAPEPDSEP